MIAFDAHFIMLALRPAIPASVDHAKHRVLGLLESLQKSGERILVPTPALTEFLVHAESAAPAYMDELQKSSRFKIAPYGIRASVEVASIIATAIKEGNKRSGSKDTWAKVKFDRQIAAIAKVEGCHTIYTDDDNLKSFAEALGMKAITLQDVPVPPSKTPLFDNLAHVEPTPEEANIDLSKELGIDKA